MRVVVSFEGDKDGVSILNFQDNQFGEPGQMRFLEFGPQEFGVAVELRPDSNQIVVRHHTEKSRVRVTYLLKTEQWGKPFYDYCCYRPILSLDYFHVQGGHLLAVPDNYYMDNLVTHPVAFKWIDFPEGWVLHNSFGPNRDQVANLTASQLTTAIFVGGDFERHRFEVKGSPAYFLTRGQWKTMTTDTLTHLLRTVIEGHRVFWQDYSDTIYSVTFLPIDDAPWSDTSKIMSYGGSGLTNSFMSYATNNPGLVYGGMRYLFMHELMHHWIGTKIQNSEEEKQYWFSEGFTEYFTLKNMLRYGLVNVDVFLKEFNNNMVQPHYMSPYVSMPNDSINYRTFWKGDKDWEKLPYHRGCLYAFYLDNQLRKATKGRTNLDQVMLEILHAMVNDPSKKLDHVFFKSILKKYLGKKGVKDFERYIEQGVPIRFDTLPLPEGLEHIRKDITFSYGPSEDVITQTVKVEQVPVFVKKEGVEVGVLKEALLK
jgi:predicted metalloprotease with PDZ domain